METAENDTVHKVNETATSADDCSSLDQNDSSTGPNTSNESNAIKITSEVVTNTNATPYIYRQDVVKRETSVIGIVTEVAGDSDTDSSITDDEDDEDDDGNDEEDGEHEAEVGDESSNFDGSGDRNGANSKSGPLSAEQARVLWMDQTESTHNINDLTVIDRGFLHGDYVAAASDPTRQVGVVVDVNISVDLVASDESIIKDVSTKELKRVRDFAVGDYVVLGPWLGRIDDVLDNVTVQFDDGSVCKVMRAEPLRLKPLSKNILEDGHFPYYPGQRVRASSSSVFKNSRWLSGLWRANRLEGTVTKVTVGSVFIYWIASAGYGPDSSTTPAEEQSPKNLKLLSCFAHANWQLGDWCLFSPKTLSSSIPLDKGFSKLELHDSANVSKEPVHETWPLHRKKIRKVVVRRDKKTRKKEESFEKAVLIINTRTKVDVAWQDGTTERGVSSTNLIPIDSPGDHEFVAEQYVVEKASDDLEDTCEARRVGVVKSVNAKEKTTCVRWLKPVSRPEDPREFDKEEIVSVYELEGHPDYDYCYGDVVVRLSPVSISPQSAPDRDFLEDSEQHNETNEVQENLEKFSGYKKFDISSENASANFSDLSWVGHITSLKDGDIEVTWADGMVSTVGPQAIYVVGRDDDDDSIAAGSEVSDAASWETVEDDDEMDALDTREEVELQNAVSDMFSEAEESRENNSGRNPALAVPLAALRFVTRLATGIFSRGQKISYPIGFDSNDEGEIQVQHEDVSETSGGKDSSSGSNSQKSIVIESGDTESEHGKGEEHAPLGTSKMLYTAENLCHLRTEEPDASDGKGVENCSFKRFDIAKEPSDHYFLGANGQTNGRKWFKKVQQDWSILQNNLPDGIYVRVYEDRMDLLRAVIVGAYGTPYQDGLFFFDFHLPPEYPDVPPSAYYHSGGWRINPNLYEEGKVCLSLLNTWTGRGNEVWDPKSSSILQVLVSLQGLVLNSKPYFNEAGYDKQIGTAEGEKNSLSYNENTFLLNCKTMMYLMRKSPKDFEDLVKEHFRRRGHYILKACDAYMNGYLIGSLAKDASLSDRSEANSTSVGFKLMLAKIVPKLFSALCEVGADCGEFEHLQHS
ncbi:putative ubiquitin-conjugating enzyme E2 23 [Morus notabilis]|uniref:E2 ubiquitin-conjugating enzyme n=1 Tax=Morus notabilis TaxID=981085 RepID=W9RXG6_9ROSA|nr:putative ubiquitin-conjugating enzyme E2 23 [Morus notabilis]